MGTRIKDLGSTSARIASDDYFVTDGATNGARKITKASIETSLGKFEAATITAAKAIASNSDNKTLVLRGGAADLDGRQGLFVWDPGASSTAAHADSLEIVPSDYSAGTGVWKRVTEDSGYSVKWFGAKGDGVTDDAAAIQNCIDAAEADDGVPYFPPGAYLIGTTLVFKKACHASNKAIIKVSSGLKNGTAIQLGEDGVRNIDVEGYRFVLPQIINDQGTGTDWSTTGSSIGIHLMTMQKAVVVCPFIKGFGAGIKLESRVNPGGAADNDIFCNHIVECQRGIWLYSGTSGGWINENNFWGGKVSVSSSYAREDPSVNHIRIEPNATFSANGNKFWGINLEGNVPVHNTYVDFGQYNEFIGCRWEDGGSTFSHTGSSDLSFVASTKKITRPSGSFITDGFEVGQVLTVASTSSNDGKYIIDAVTALEITVQQALVDESNTSGTVSAGGDPVIYFDFEKGESKWNTIMGGNHTYALEIANGTGSGGTARGNVRHSGIDWEFFGNKPSEPIMKLQNINGTDKPVLGVLDNSTNAHPVDWETAYTALLTGNSEFYLKTASDATGRLVLIGDTSNGSIQLGNGTGSLNTLVTRNSSNNGNPNTVVTANKGSLVLDATAGGLWVKRTGTGTNTGWIRASENNEDDSHGDEDVTLVINNPRHNRFVTTLTQNRTVTLPASGMVEGDSYWITTNGIGGTYTVDVGGLKTLADTAWCYVVYDGSAWRLIAAGSL